MLLTELQAKLDIFIHWKTYFLLIEVNSLFNVWREINKWPSARDWRDPITFDVVICERNMGDKSH